ncbi:MAG: MFS transporter [Lachnospiraceae bacterium]|nr:MFS transporter [Lachnospiraceae bacterium]
MCIRASIYLMYAIGLLQGMVFYGPIATLYRQAQGVSVLQITIIESISLILCLLLEFPWGMIADKIGYKRTILFCCVLYFLSKIVFWQASCFGGFLLERVMLSVVIAGLSGVDSAFLYLSCKKGESQKVFGIYNSLGTAGLLFASLLFSLFVGSNYRLAGFLTVISYGLSALLAMGLTEVKREKEKASGTESLLLPLQQIFKNKNILLFLIGIALLNETHQTVTVFLSQLQYERCGLTISAMGYIYILVTVAGLCGAWSFGLTKKLGDFRLTVFLYAVAALSCILLAVTDSPWLSVIGILTLRIAFSLFQPLQTELQNRQIQAENRATALSVNAVIIDSVGAGTNIAFGTMAEKSLFTTFLFGAGLCMLGSIFVLRQIKKI